MVGISTVRKAKRSMQRSKPEGIYYSTIDETKLQRIINNKPEAPQSELTDMQLSKEEPQYMEIFKNAPGSSEADI